MKNYYKILEISSDASLEVIKSAFRRLVKKWHPDRNPDPDAIEMVRQIYEAYEILSNSSKRKQYDAIFNTINPSEKQEEVLDVIINSAHIHSENFSKMKYEEVEIYFKIIFKRIPDIFLTIFVLLVGILLTIGAFFNESFIAIIISLPIGVSLVIVGIRDIDILFKIKKVKSNFDFIPVSKSTF